MYDTHTKSTAKPVSIEILPHDGRSGGAMKLALPERFALTPVEARRVATLERRAPSVVERARAAGVRIEHIGIGRLFDDHRFYPGIDTDWVLKPADETEDVVLPRAERQALQKLQTANITFPAIFVAHEIAKKVENSVLTDEAQPYTSIEPTTSSDLVGPVPAPIASLELGDRLSHRSEQILTGLRRTLLIAGTAIAAPVVVAGAAVAGLAAGLATLDPIVIGAIPAVSAEPGKPASFFVLARWDW